MKNFLKSKINIIGIERIKRLSKESSIILFGQIFSISCSLILVKLLSSNLTPSQFGDYTLALAIGGLVCQVAFSNSLPGISRYFLLSLERKDFNVFLKKSIILMFKSSFVSIIFGFFVALYFIFFGNSKEVLLISIAIIFLILSNFNVMFIEFQHMIRNRKIAIFHGALDSTLKLFFIFILFNFFTKNSFVVLFSLMLSMTIVLFFHISFIKKFISCQESIESVPTNWKKNIRTYSSPFLLINLFSGLQAGIDRWSLDYFATRSEVGLLAPLTQLGYTPLLMISGLTTTLFGPILFKKSGDGTSKKRNLEVGKFTNIFAAISMLIILLIFIFTLLFHDLIFKVFVNENYFSVSYLLPWMVLSGGFFSISQMFSLKLMSDLDTKSLKKPKIITSILAVLLSILGAYIAGIKGVVFCSLIFSTILLFWMTILSNKSFYKKKFKFIFKI